METSEFKKKESVGKYAEQLRRKVNIQLSKSKRLDWTLFENKDCVYPFVLIRSWLGKENFLCLK
jgi:hypothetical protein